MVIVPFRCPVAPNRRAAPERDLAADRGSGTSLDRSGWSGGSAPRVLVIPGIEGSVESLRAIAPALFPDMRPVLFDHRLDPAEDGMEGLAERALAVLDRAVGQDDERHDEGVFVAGESFGGAVALTLARLYPRRVRGLLLLSTFGRYPHVSTYVARTALALWRVLGDGAADRFIRTSRTGSLRVLRRRSGGEPGPDHLSLLELLPPCHLPAYRAKANLCLRFDARPWLNGIRCPAFILAGTDDPFVPPSAGRELARLLPNARLHCLPGDHGVHVARAREVGRLIAAWAGEVAQGSAAAAA